MPLFWSSQRWPAPVRYGTALATVGAAACFNYLLHPVYGESHYFFFSVAVLATGLFGGIGPGLLATGASAMTSAYFFVYPFHSVRVDMPEAAHRLAMFILEGAIISLVAQVIRSNRTPEVVSIVDRYGSAVALVAGATVLKLILFPGMGPRLPFTFFYSAVVATAWVAGAAPGLLATALSAASVYYFFSGADHATAPHSPGFVLFALEASVLCLLTATFRQRLVETEEHLGRVFDDSPLGVLIVEGGSRIAKANPAFRKTAGSGEPSIEGRKLTDLVCADSQNRVTDFLEHMSREQTEAVADQICLQTGATAAWVNLHGSWIREGAGREQTCLVMVEDITERRKTEEALRETEARLQRGQRMEALGLLAGGIAHDFNNLLAVIFGCCENLLQQKDLPAEARASAEELFQTAKTAADFTRQLLSFARGGPPPEQLVDLNGLVSETAGLLRRLIGANIELKIILAPDAGSVRADPSQLQQILMNLAANAKDAMPAGGRLTIQTMRTTIAAAAPAGQYSLLQVSDTGHGMDETTQARIFEPLFTTKDLDKGTGLGLATVHSIVKKLGGYLRLESAPGEGACFSIYLPSADVGTGASSGAGDRAEPDPEAAREHVQTQASKQV